MAKNTLVASINETIPNTINISDEAMDIFILVIFGGVCQAVALFGVVSNIINIMCFIKQGFNEPVNISLLGLALADLGGLTSQIGINAMYSMAVIEADDLSFDPIDVMYITVGMCHLAFSRVNIWITVIITMERCLCITIPLKMKHVVTTKRVWVLILCVYVVCICSGSPVFAVNRLDIMFNTELNRTLLGLVVTPAKDKVEAITFTINSFLLPFVAFIRIIICTAILVVNLRKRARWLKFSSMARKADDITRDQKVAKMVVMISVLFIVCFVPMAVILLAAAFEPNLNLGGTLVNISKIVGIIAHLMESVNSSANIFIYYQLSIRYREAFHAIFCLKCNM